MRGASLRSQAQIDSLFDSSALLTTLTTLCRPEETAKFVNESLRANPTIFSFESITSQPVGIFLFSRWVASRDAVSLPRMGMIEAVARWRRLVEPVARAETARGMFDRFLASVNDDGNACRAPPAFEKIQETTMYRRKCFQARARTGR